MFIKENTLLKGMKYVFALILFLLCLQLVSAEDEATLKLISLKDQISAGEAAEFELVVTNNQQIRDVFRISYEPYAVYPLSDSIKKIIIEPEQVTLDPGESAKVNISVRTLPYAQPDRNYILTLGVSSLVNQEVRTAAQLKLAILEIKEPIALNVNSQLEIVPGKISLLEIKLQNKFDKELYGVELRIETNFPGLAGSLLLNLLPNQEIIETRELKLPLNANVKTYEILISVFHDGLELERKTIYARVPEKPFVDEQKRTEYGFLTKKEVITQKNSGNTIAIQEIQIALPWFKRFFTSFEPVPEEGEDGVYSWKFSLAPGEQVKITLESNYRSLLYGLIVLIIAIALVFLFAQRMVVVKKRVIKIRDLASGVSEMRVIIHLQNGKRYPLTEVSLIDLMPNYVEVPSEFMTLKPDRLQHGTKTIRLFWNISRLEPREERVVSYKVKTKLALVAGNILPPASLHFLDNKHQLKTIQSERVIIAGPSAENS